MRHEWDSSGVDRVMEKTDCNSNQSRHNFVFTSITTLLCQQESAVRTCKTVLRYQVGNVT